MNRDGKQTRQTVDDAYAKGMRTLVRNVKQALGPSRSVIVNSSLDFANEANGVLFENFPRYGFSVPFDQMRQVIEKNQNPKPPRLIPKDR